MITLYLEATSLAELKQMALVALDLGRVPTTDEVAAAKESIKRPVGRPRKVQPDPAPEIDPLEEGFLSNEDGIVVSVPGLEPDDIPQHMDDNHVPEPNGAGDPIALEKLKAETVAKLPDMFAAGKVNLMRAVLTKYGKGAKSFPEIEAKDFPEIAAALARGDGS
jgi:hypothetical protein